MLVLSLLCQMTHDLWGPTQPFGLATVALECVSGLLENSVRRRGGFGDVARSGILAALGLGKNQDANEALAHCPTNRLF